MKITLRNIFWVFFKIGALLLGGGYVILPILQAEIVDKRHWVSKDDLIEYYALSQCIPGIIAVNTAIFAGYKVRGKFGAITAVTAMCLSPFLVIICLAAVLSKLTHIPLVHNIFWGVGISIIILILMTVEEVWEKSIVDKFSFLLFLSVFLITVLFQVSPVISILAAMAAGVVYKIIQRRMS